MPEGPVDPEDNPEDGRILAPDELDISDSENVRQLDEGRFVVSPDSQSAVDATSGAGAGPEPDPDAGSAPDTPSTPGPESASGSDTGGHGREGGQNAGATGGEPAESLDRERVHRWLRESFAGADSRYGFDATATFDGSVSQRRMASNDVVTIFESLMLWYAQQVDSDTPVEEILGILLMESNVPIRYPPESLRNLLQSTNLGPEDTIADLLAAVDDDDGVKL